MKAKLIKRAAIPTATRRKREARKQAQVAPTTKVQQCVQQKLAQRTTAASEARKKFAALFKLTES
jgi:hypothetical protein